MPRRTCAVCRESIEQPDTGRRRQYCSNACRQRAWKRSKRRSPASRMAWWTPEPLRSEILAEYNITLDAAACAQSRLVPRYLGLDHQDPLLRDALAPHIDWAELAGPGGVVFLNPPYMPINTLSAFLGKAVATAAAGTPAVGVVPASVTTRWFTTHITEAGAKVRFVPGRVRFDGPHSTGGFAPWGVALVEWSSPADPAPEVSSG